MEALEMIEYPIIKIEKPEYCKLLVNYTGDPEIVASKLEEGVTALRAMRVPGFRPGKAPDQAIKSKLKPQLNNFIAREMITHAIDEITFDNDLKVNGNPNVTNVVIKGNKFSCDLEIFTSPEFELGETKFDVPKPDVDGDVEKATEGSLMNLRTRVGELTPYEEDDTVELGDKITLTFKATIDGEDYEALAVEGQMYSVGEYRWRSFDDHLIGMKADETKTFDFTFEDGPEELVGKTAKFTATVHMGTKLRPHDINEEFLKKMGVETIEILTEKLREISIATFDRQEKEAIRRQVSIKLVEGHDFEVPAFMVDNEVKSLVSNAQLPLEELSDEERESFTVQATKNIKLSLILDSVREAEPDSVLNDGEARQHVAKHLQSQGQDPAIIFGNKQFHGQLALFVNSVKNEFTMQWVADQANIIE